MKNRVFYLKNFSFLEVKLSIYLNRRVFVMYTNQYCTCEGTGVVLLSMGSSLLKAYQLILTFGHILKCHSFKHYL